MKKNKLIEFKSKVSALCKEYNISISHEDVHGGFIFETYDEFYDEWFNYGLWFNEDELEED